MGVSSIEELEETCRVFNSVVEGLEPEGADSDLMNRRQQSHERRAKIEAVVEKMWAVLGSWKDYSWDSPGPEFVNKAVDVGVTPDDGVLMRRYLDYVICAGGIITAPRSRLQDVLLD
ncbi:hypothetical protein NUW58_g3816 [Xylaria curta]|uniref:Uncharacterized protein n=1 Tax=Xylaria curta TaxID=42375 RepID=A0ACC1PAN7_9PEZI|nr:hypothetical protein NUW58_g3816 [Xylaria curta]